MKRLISLVCAVAMLFLLVACDSKKADKYCVSCGSGMDESDAFCRECGTAVGGTGVSSSADATTESTTITTTTEETTTTSLLTTTTTAKPATTKKPTITTTKKTTKKKTTAKPNTTSLRGGKTTARVGGITTKKQSAVDNAFEYLTQWVEENGDYEDGEIQYIIEGYSSDLTFSLVYDTENDWLFLRQVGQTLGSVSVTTLYLEANVYAFYFLDSKIQGVLDAEEYTEDSDLPYRVYEGSEQNKEFAFDTAKLSLNALLEALRNVLLSNGLPITLADFGFTRY